MPIQSRSIPRQILYLTLALAGLQAVLIILAHWNL